MLLLVSGKRLQYLGDLMAMGFPVRTLGSTYSHDTGNCAAAVQEDQARKALQAVGDEIDSALTWLVDNPAA